MPAPEATLRDHHVLVSADNAFQRRARLLQSFWREDQGLPIGEHRGQPLGSRLPMPRAQERLENFLTENIRDCVRREVIEASAGDERLIQPDRLFANLLSSQPLCFNLFAELQADLALATAVLARLPPDRIGEVTAIRFEHSPGRCDLRFTGDRSAHDVFVEYTSPTGGRGFVGIEVKYHEAMRDKPSKPQPRRDEIADAMGIFRPEHRAALADKPLEQMWRDHLLAGSLVLADVGFDEGTFAFVYPERNDRCADAVARYAETLSDDATFRPWTLESVVGAIAAECDAAWVGQVRGRYLDFERVDALLR